MSTCKFSLLVSTVFIHFYSTIWENLTVTVRLFVLQLLTLFLYLYRTFKRKVQATMCGILVTSQVKKDNKFRMSINGELTDPFTNEDSNLNASQLAWPKLN